MSKRSGFEKRGVALTKLLPAVCFLPLALLAQFSPGALSKAHSKLDGPLQCANCHIGGGGGRKLTCTGCHTEIKQRLASNQGLHPGLMGAGRRDDQCAKCHSEHNGAQFVPILWDVNIEDFDHRKAGYRLEGGHAGLKCARCHTPLRIMPAARKGILMRDLKRTFLGLSTNCASCHEDKHKGQVGDQCERCHVVSKWKDVTRFDHATAKYKLTGAHARVECAKCHPKLPGSTMARYTGLPFARCTDCHKDPHRGSFAAACESCHNDIAWKAVKGVATAFDHSKTKYPLLGKHAPVPCAKCHKTSDYKAPVAHGQCKDCHKDIHSGQFAARAGAGECAPCHTADGWKPALYTVAAHAGSAYPLLGKHAAVACAKCHPLAGAAMRYKVRYQLCIDCHKDPHAGQFAAAPHQDHCENCHTVDRFQPAKFTLSRHTQTRFPLEGGHVAVACGDCHMRRPELHNAVVYRFTDFSCGACHMDPHQAPLKDRRAAANPRTATACDACHNVREWRRVANFDHSKTRFSLNGAHRVAACEQCHRATALSVGTRKVVFVGAPLACVGCHEDIHAGQFTAVSSNKNCQSCHDNLKWKPGLFDHQRTSFKLDGAHDRVPCKDCHTTRKEINGRLVVFYKPTPADCVSCHGPNLKK